MMEIALLNENGLHTPGLTACPLSRGEFLTLPLLRGVVDRPGCVGSLKINPTH